MKTKNKFSICAMACLGLAIIIANAKLFAENMLGLITDTILTLCLVLDYCAILLRLSQTADGKLDQARDGNDHPGQTQTPQIKKITR